MVTSAMRVAKWRSGIGVLMCLIVLGIAPGTAFADAVGTVLFVDGDVKVSTGGAEKRSLSKSDVIVEGDLLVTGENSSVQIKMRDGGLVAVRANTELKFDIFTIARNPGEPQSSVMSLVKGSLRAITGLIGRVNKQEYKVSTPVATIGIRGTDHEAAFIPTALPGVPAGAYSKVNVGQTTLTTAAGTVLVNPNQMAFAGSPNAAPQIRPVNANLFTAVPPPAATASSNKKDGGSQTATTTAGGGQSSQQGGQSSQQGGQTAQNDNQNQGQGQGQGPAQNQGQGQANQGPGQTQSAQAGGQGGQADNQAPGQPGVNQGPREGQAGPTAQSSGNQGGGQGPAAQPGIGPAGPAQGGEPMRAAARVDSTMQAVALNVQPMDAGPRMPALPAAGGIAAGPAAGPAAAAPVPTTSIVPIQLKSDTLALNTTTQTISAPGSSTTSLTYTYYGLVAMTTTSLATAPVSPSSANNYGANYIVPVPVSSNGTLLGYTVGEVASAQSTALTSSAIQLYGSGNLYSLLGTSFQQKNSTTAITNANVIWNGGTAFDYFQSTDQSVTFGRWQGGTVSVTDASNPSTPLTFNLNQSGSMIGPTSSLWTYVIAPPAGYVQTLSGTSNYSKVGNTTPFDSVGGAGVLNSATLTANFSTQTVSAGVQLTMNSGPYASDVFNINASMPINLGTSANPSGFKVGTTSPSVSCSAGPCTGNSFTGEMRGSFAGANAASAILGYGIWATPSSGPPADIVNGYVAFAAAAPPVAVALAPYAGGELAVEYQSSNLSGMGYQAPASNTVVPTATGTQTASFTIPASATDYYPGYSSTSAFAVTSSVLSSVSNGIRYGSSSYNSATYSYSQPLGGGGPSQWIVGPQAYFDANNLNMGLPIVAQLSYSLAGGTSPVGRAANGAVITGTLNSASVTANLTNQTVSATVSATALNNTYQASASNMPFYTAGSGSNFAANPFYGAAVVTNSSTSAPCSTATCGGYISGGFTGQNYAGTLLSYNLYDSGAGINNLGGVAALSRTSATDSNNNAVTIAPSTATPTGNFLVGNNTYYGSVSLANSATFSSAGVLTGYADSSSSTTITCTTCSVTSTGIVPSNTGISYGTWDQGTYQSSYSTGASPGQLYWITGPEPTPYYLPQVLTQQATYTFAGGAVGTPAGPGTISSGSTLTADFSKQTVAVNLSGTANVGTSVTPANVNWTASTPNALIGANCSSNGCFNANNIYYSSTGPGYLTAMIGGQSASGSLSGQFTGANLTGAIVSFGLNGGSSSSNIQGVGAFSNAGADPLTPYRLAAFSINDSVSSISSAELNGGYQPAAAVGFDTNGMLNKILLPPNSVSGNSYTNSITTSSLSFTGGTFSPLSGFLGANSQTGTACNPCTDAVTGISWGRWSTVSIATTDLLNTNTSTNTTNSSVRNGGVVWVSTPSLTGPVKLPVSGTYSYGVTGGTNPIDSTGAQGVLNSASLTANFTQQTVNLGVNVTMPAPSGSTSTSITASASNVPIVKGAEFSAGPGSATALSVTCSGTACGTSPQGKVGGVFVGAAGQGAVMGYVFAPNPSISNTITGVVGFRR